MKKDGLAVEGEGDLVQRRQVSPITATRRMFRVTLPAAG